MRQARAYRAEVLLDIEATLTAHVPDDTGICLGCRDNKVNWLAPRHAPAQDDATYPCAAVAFALHAADLLIRRLAAGGPPDRKRGVVEIDLSRAVWHRPGSCDNSGGSCVEVAFVGDSVAVRNSDGPDGPIVIYTKAEWDVFIQGVRDGEFAA
jgi:hypothetical protein